METKVIGERWDLELKRGDRWPELSFTVKDQKDEVVSLMNATISMEVKTVDRSSTVIKSINSTNGGFTIVDDVVKFTTNIDLKSGSYVYDIQVLLPAYPKPFTIYYGKIKVKQDTTAIAE